MRRLLLPLLSVAALLAGGVGLVAFFDRAPPLAAPPPSPAAAVAAAPPTEPPPPSPLVAPPPAPAPRPAAPGTLARPPAVVAQAGAWEQVAPVPAESWPSLTRAIEQARPSLAPCYDPEVQARYGGRPYAAVGAPKPGGGVPVVLFQLEAMGQGRVRVVEAPVEARGAAEDGLLACFQEKVRGMTVQGQGQPGARYRVRYAMAPMVQGLPQAPIRQKRGVRPKAP